MNVDPPVDNEQRSAPISAKQRIPKARVWAIGGGIAATVGVASVVIPWAADLATQSSSSDSVEVVAEQPTEAPPTTDPLAGAVVLGDVMPEWETTLPTSKLIDWVIPASAPMTSFPQELGVDEWGYNRCSDEQYAWLEQFASPWYYNPTLDVSLRNNADVGGAVSLTNVRFDGEETHSEPLVRFECPTGGRGDGPTQLIILDMTSGNAVWGPHYGMGDGGAEGSPVTINVAPGEATELVFTRSDLQRSYSGRIIADVAGENSDTFIIADDVSFERNPVPGYFIGYGNQAYEDGLLRCATLNQSEAVPCGLDDAAALLASLADSDPVDE